MIGRRLAAGLLVACAAVIVAGRPAPVAADCDGPYPSFREAAPSARRVVIGDVVAMEPVDQWLDMEGRSSRFTLQAWSILDGVGPVVVPVRDLVSQPCAGYLFGKVGDQVAIAFDGRAFSNRIEVNAIAWVGGRAPDRIGIESLTVGEVFMAVGLPVPAVFPPQAVSADAPDPGPSWLPVAAVVAGLLAAAVVLRRVLA